MREIKGWHRALSALCFVLAVAAWSAPAIAADAKCEPDKIATKYPELAGKTFKVGIPADSKPFAYRDPANMENMAGLFVDYARATFACIGAPPVEFAVATFSGLLSSLASGQTDLVWALLYYTPERAKSIDFVLYMRGSSGVVVLKDKPNRIHSLDDLCGLRVAAPAGSVEITDIQKTSDNCVKSGKPAIDSMITPDRASGLRLLDNDRIDASFGIGMKQVYDQALYTFAFTYLSDVEMGVGVRKGNKVMEQAIYDALLALRADGTEQKLYDKYEMDPALRVEPKIMTE